MSHNATQSWLKACSAGVAVFGVLVALAAHPATDAFNLFLTDMVFWPLDGKQSFATPEARLLNAIVGGLTAGLGVMLWITVAKLYPRDPGLARTLILATVLTWFVIDSTGSIVAGAPGNALFNTVFLLAFVIPLWRRTSPEA